MTENAAAILFSLGLRGEITPNGLPLNVFVYFEVIPKRLMACFYTAYDRQVSNEILSYWRLTYHGPRLEKRLVTNTETRRKDRIFSPM